LWIDSKDFVVLQVEFELLEPVRMWGGLLGSLSRLRGRLTMTELGGGAWHYETLDIHVKGRVLFNSFHQDQRMTWKNFKPIEAAALGVGGRGDAAELSHGVRNAARVGLAREQFRRESAAHRHLRLPDRTVPPPSSPPKDAAPH
jgi:hypothetical protein